MREVKFRQRLKEKFWHNGEKFHYWGYVEDGFVSPVGKNESAADSEQLTGLTDRNGVDIYEGDILSAYHYEYEIKQNTEVKFANGIFTVGSYWKDGIHDWHSMEQYDNIDLKVVGNIHENPEILEATG